MLTSAPRRLCAPSFVLMMISLLLAAPDAHAGSYSSPVYSSGLGCFTQLVQPKHQYNGIGIGANNNVNGLDNSFKYFNYTWAPGSKGTENDSPAILAGPGNKVGDVDTANDSFQTWLMYQPPGGVWVPLQKLIWSTNITVSNTSGAWAVSPGNAVTTPASGTDIPDPPTWSTVNVASQTQMRP